MIIVIILFRAPIEIRNRLNFKEIERTMHRAHKKCNPGPVKSLEELIHEWSERNAKVNGEPFFLGRFGSDQEEWLTHYYHIY